MMSFDVGEKSIGVAVSDPTQTVVTPHAAFIFSKNQFPLQAITDKIKEVKPYKIVVGHPISVDDTKSSQTQKIEAFYDRLKKKYPDVEWALHDERHSTWTVRKKYPHLHLVKRQHPQNIDSFAAMEILMDYIGLPSKEF